MNIVLINIPLKSTVCDLGVGHQIPLGLLMIGGPLLDAGHSVHLVDAACDRLTVLDTVDRALRLQPDVVMAAHVGATPAHPTALDVFSALKAAQPSLLTIYGGVHATYHDREIIARYSCVDVIVRGEGEETTLNCIRALVECRSVSHRSCDLSAVQGITWRDGGRIVRNPTPPVLDDLDSRRVGWELIEDWDRYQAFGLGRAAVVQFSRGCPHTCTFCGQWSFWRKWRHRDVVRFVDELEFLNRDCGVRFFWLADENPTTDPQVWRSLLEEITRRSLDIGLCGSLRAADIVRDASFLHLYSSAGFVFILMGAETVTDEGLSDIRKQSTTDDVRRAVRLLRGVRILSIVDCLFGLDNESLSTIRRTWRGLQRYDGDFVNALYLTPHSWTPLGRSLSGATVVQPDLRKWDYRHQVLEAGLSPTALFLGVKVVELLYHLHPRRLWKLRSVHTDRVDRVLRFSYLHTALVFWAEIYEFARDRLAHVLRHPSLASGDRTGFMKTDRVTAGPCESDT
jgi:anaerobic magnesium-protoporphyrin IX monomethyl ester cyclase